MKVIMVPVADRPECEAALKQAFGLARAFGGNILGCHLRAGENGASNRKAQLRILAGKTHQDRKGARQADAVGRAAHKLFVQEANRHDFELSKKARVGMQHAAQWFEIGGDIDKLFPIVGPVADMSIVSRPKAKAKGRANEFMLSAVMHSGKPVLVIPQSPKPVVGKRILIAWDQSIDAARAVAAALPLLRLAKSVVICSCGPENQPGPKSASVAQFLAFHGVKTSHKKAKGRDIPRELESVAGESKSDLIVMGAYSRSRMTEIWFGGVTEHMLFKTSRAIFAYHS